MTDQAILLPGVIMPARDAYEALIEALGAGVEATAKELEVYAAERPPHDYSLETEIDGILGAAEKAGLERFHLVGYSGGGAIAAAFGARHPGRLASLALLEAAWLGNEGRSAGELRVWEEIEKLRGLPPGEMMATFVSLQLAPGIEPPSPPPGPPPDWMALRPGGIDALSRAFEAYELEPDRLRALPVPVYYALGGRSNPDYYGEMARRCEDLFRDFTLEVFEDRHHFEPPHRFEPERLASSLLEHWRQADRAAERGS